MLLREKRRLGRTYAESKNCQPASMCWKRKSGLVALQAFRMTIDGLHIACSIMHSGQLCIRNIYLYFEMPIWNLIILDIAICRFCKMILFSDNQKKEDRDLISGRVL